VTGQPFYDFRQHHPKQDEEFKTVFTIEGDFADWVHNWLIPFARFNDIEEEFFNDEWKQEQIDDNFGLGYGRPDVDEQDYYGYFAEQAFWEIMEFLGMTFYSEGMTFVPIKDKVIWVNYDTTLSNDEIYAKAW
jgi:hypothetical protein